MKVKNSLQLKAILIISLTFIVFISTVTSIEYINSKHLVMSFMEDSGRQTVTIHAQNLSSWVKSRLSQVEVIANTPVVSSMDYKQIMPYFQREQKSYDGVFNSFGISGTDGKMTLQNNVNIDISSETTFPEVLSGKNVISDPFPDKQNASNLIISMECPVRDVTNNKIVGVVSGASLVSTVFKENTSFHIGKTDKVYILSKDGTVIFNNSNKKSNSNFLKSSNNELRQQVQSALQKNSFLGQFRDGNETKMLFSAKVEGTNWYMFLEVPTSEYTKGLADFMLFIIGVTIFAIVFIIILSVFLLRRFFNRLIRISYIAEEVAAGNLQNSLPEDGDELGRINITFNKMIENLKSVILKIKGLSEVVVQSSNSCKNVSTEVIDAGKGIRQSIENLTSGAKNTAEEIQKITVSVNDMENKSKELVDISSNIDEMINQTKDKTSEGSENLNSTIDILRKMEKSVKLTSGAVEELSGKSKAIASITTAITTISDQTNLLALNANIEAARAGEYGRGFFVVADEVRKLAEQSSTATTEISKEIQQVQEQIANAVTAMKDSINYVNLGNSSIDNILSVFTGIEGDINKIKKMSTQIFEIAKALLSENEVINEAISNTSAISEESVASTVCFEDMIIKQEDVFLNLKEAAEDLDKLSASLSDEVSNFKVK